MKETSPGNWVVSDDPDAVEFRQASADLEVLERIASRLTGSEREALWDIMDQLSPEIKVADIEKANKRWHGTTPEIVRWEPYKPDGQRQMRAKGRWQRLVILNGGYHKWENCPRPTSLRQEKR